MTQPIQTGSLFFTAANGRLGARVFVTYCFRQGSCRGAVSAAHPRAIVLAPLLLGDGNSAAHGLTRSLRTFDRSAHERLTLSAGGARVQAIPVDASLTGALLTVRRDRTHCILLARVKKNEAGVSRAVLLDDILRAQLLHIALAFSRPVHTGKGSRGVFVGNDIHSQVDNFLQRLERRRESLRTVAKVRALRHDVERNGNRIGSLDDDNAQYSENSKKLHFVGTA